MRAIVAGTLALTIVTSSIPLSAAESRRVTNRQRDADVSVHRSTMTFDPADTFQIYRPVAPNEERVLFAQQRPPVVATGNPISRKTLMIIGASILVFWIVIKMTVPDT